MRIQYSVTPKHWEIGFGFYVGGLVKNEFSSCEYYFPPTFTVMFGPWSLELAFGDYVEVRE